MESKQQHINAIEFAERWKDHGDEKQELLVILKNALPAIAKYIVFQLLSSLTYN